MTELEKILNDFAATGLSEQERQAIIDGGTPEIFKTIAKEILCGRFAVTSGGSTVFIVPTAVELYYHEEEADGIKDNIVYHRGTVKGQLKPKFEIGILHEHYSGIDITFEYTANGRTCRASALIREFRVINGNSDDIFQIKSPEGRCTYFPKVLVSQFSIFQGFSIKWEDHIDSSSVALAIPAKRVGVKKDDNRGIDEKQALRKWHFSLSETTIAQS